MSTRPLASWVVEYQDGTFVAQYDAAHPTAIGGEVPFRAIDWSRARAIRFESQWTVDTFDLFPPPPGYRLALRSRRWTSGIGDHAYMAFLLVVCRDGVDVHDAGALAEATEQVVYWFPNGVTHTCPHLDCVSVRQYAQNCVHQLPDQGLPSFHAAAAIQATVTAFSG